MAKLSKKQKVMAGKIESDKNYAIEEAVLGCRGGKSKKVKNGKSLSHIFQ